MEEEEDDELPLIDFQRRTDVDWEAAKRKTVNNVLKKKKIKKIKKPVELSVEENLSEEALKRKIANEDVDKALSKIKPKRSRRDLQDETELDEMMKAIVDRMILAAQEDRKLNEDDKPATKKLAMLPELTERLSRTSWYSQFLDNEILNAFTLWLEPMVDKSFPTQDIQRTILQTLQHMPIDATLLRSSGLGKIVNFYTRSSRIAPDIKRLALTLVEKWSRPIMQRSVDYKDILHAKAVVDTRELRKKQHVTSLQAIPDSLVVKGKATEEHIDRHHARIPMPVASAFSIVPVSDLSRVSAEVKLSDRSKKLSSRIQKNRQR